LIYIAIPDDSYVNTKGTDKLIQYKDLEIEVIRMWKLRTKILPVVTGPLGTIMKGLDMDRQLHPGHLSGTELKSTLLSTAHIIHKVLG
jgi:hypothetical protein